MPWVSSRSGFAMNRIDDGKPLEHIDVKLGVKTRLPAADMAMSRIRLLHQTFEG